MNFKKLVTAFVAAAMTVTTMAVSAFATNVAMDSEYPGAWGCSAAIPKADLEAIGGDVKVTLNVTPKVLVKDQAVLKPITVGDSWIAVETGLTSDTDVRKPDGFIVIKKSATTVSFVIDTNAIASLTDNGLQFQVYNVTINSADLEAGSPEGEFRPIDDKFAKDYTNEDKTYEELYPAAEETEAPAEEAAEETEAPAEEAAEETEAALADTAVDYSALTGDVITDTEATSGGAWGQAITLTTLKNDGGVFDPTILTPDKAVVVYYEAETAPEVVLQSWSGGEGWAKVPANEEYSTDGVAVFTYDYMTAMYQSENFVDTLDAFIVGDTGSELTVSKVLLVDAASLTAGAKDESEIIEDAAPVEEVTEAPVEEVVTEAPAADTTTPAASTGNTAAASIAAVMALAGAAALISKRK